ncbi:MAG TPA: CehA/McbA family metallohydrolase [Rhizomicrobium sp.]
MMLRAATLLLGLCLASAAQAAAVLTGLNAAAPDPGRAPDYLITGTVTGADNQTYRELPFTVPDGISRISVSFRYSGHEQHTTIDLGLFDPERFRGWSGGNKDSFTLSETDATPSYLPGPIRAGLWKLILGIPNIRKDAHADYEARIYLDRPGAPFAVSAFSNAPLKSGPAWYRGDLHMHTAHSDGECTSQAGRKVPCPLYKTVEAAAARGLDFIAISDHNAISQFGAERELQPYFDNLLLLPGREITTFNGHANVFGPTGFIDFRLGSADVPAFGTLLDQVEALHGLISINHPRLPSGEICMGCGWTVAGTDYARIQAIEIVNGGATALFGSADNPVSGIPFWEDLLDKGYRLTAIGGSDNHSGPAAQDAVGYPTTVVYAANLSDRAILDGIRSGHVFVDVDGSKDRLLEFTAHGGRVTMGDTLKVRAHERITFTVHVAGVAGGTVGIVEDGQKIAPLASSSIAGADVHKTFSLTFDANRHWLRADVKDAKGRTVLVGNPIYVNG